MFFFHVCPQFTSCKRNTWLVNPRVFNQMKRLFQYVPTRWSVDLDKSNPEDYESWTISKKLLNFWEVSYRFPICFLTCEYSNAKLSAFLFNKDGQSSFRGLPNDECDKFVNDQLIKYDTLVSDMCQRGVAGRSGMTDLPPPPKPWNPFPHPPAMLDDSWLWGGRTPRPWIRAQAPLNHEPWAMSHGPSRIKPHSPKRTY